MIDLTITIAGAAGQGMQTISYTLAKALTRQGYFVHCYQDLMSRIRGGHNFASLRISDQPVGSLSEKSNILIALNRESIDIHSHGMVEGGVVVFDEKFQAADASTPLSVRDSGKLNLFPVPLEKLALESAQNKIMVNAAACGVCFSLMEYDFNLLADTLGDLFAVKGDLIVEANIRAARAGYDYAEREFKGVCPYCTLHRKRSDSSEKMLMTGSEAAGFGSLVSGLQFLPAYPMSPSTGIMEYCAAKQKEVSGLLVEQAEDEISAVNMAIGASVAGVRAMTCTSGGGFALMTEGLSLAGMTEVPLVIFIAQRPGPATGFPTRTEQGDLLFALYGGHGEFARAILAPGDAGETVYAMQQAFNLADKYQTPVIVLGDQNLNDSFWTVDDLGLDKITIDRGKLLGNWDPAQGPYKRYHLSSDGISPRLVPGDTEEVQYWDSDEHTEEGHIAESASARLQMVSKRLHKFKGLKEESLSPVVLGDSKETVLVGFGSTKWAVREAVEKLREKGEKVSAAHFSQVYPLPKETVELLSGFKKIIVVEQNATGQFEKLLQLEAGIKADGSIRKFDGRPLTAKYIVDSYEVLG
ncbi:MAG: 2-oxoacid:acceptor oxidoreductase subunit alpha [bacterium]|nr:2-oxoacid:acceptor oxidoreductase subunit alpha [bacterium]